MDTAQHEKAKLAQAATIEKLRQLQRVLIEAERQEQAGGPRSRLGFDMSYWHFQRGASGCGTTACAAGWAALDPWFNERGLYVEIPYRRKGLNMQGVVRYNDPASGTAEPNRPTSESSADAVARFFGLRYSLLEFIFLGYAFDDSVEPRQIKPADVWHACAAVIRYLSGMSDQPEAGSLTPGKPIPAEAVANVG